LYLFIFFIYIFLTVKGTLSEETIAIFLRQIGMYLII